MKYEEYLKEISKEFIFYNLKNKEKQDYSKEDFGKLYLVFYCDEWITTSSIRIVGVLTEDHLRDFLVEEIKNGNIEWKSIHSPQDISLKEIRENLQYASFSPIRINDY